MLRMKRIVFIVIIIAVIGAGTFGIKYLIDVQNYKKTISNLKIDTIDISNIPDGKYTGVCDTKFVGSEVLVTVKDKKITDIKLVNHKNERGKPAEVILENVIKAQSLKVDTISGATNSSKVILKSIENALDTVK
ncbi:FMN-binding domain protein [Clostridium puniceum]|uniref:FMN-binding domain protein n=1 Tax=Clostridium puniceum TaxID=29367 RepID=A0A1S8SX22_9CLOT|nr:FMN-binding protein [Clostridium puniceum]OOM69983.1 FMN-binding domain protein [Clostridium puniceum]